MRSIVRGVVALFAAFLMMDVAKAAPTIVSPAENAEVKTISDKIWNDIHNDSVYLNQSTFYEGTHTGTYRKSAMADVNTNSVPIKLKWSGTSGECTVKIWRTKDLTANSSASPIFSTKVTGTTATYWDPEVGRNFTWSVTDSTGASATGHFHTIQRTPRVIYGDQNPNSPGADCSAGRDIGGWLTEDKTKRVRQGLVFRSAQIEYCSSGADDHIYYPLTYLKDVIGIKLDIDLRTDSHLGKYYAYPTNKVWTCSWKKGNADYSDEYLRKAESNIGPGVLRFCVDTSYAEFPSYTGFTSNNNNKKSVWAAFKQIHDRVTKTNPEAVLFHCSHGKDRTGSLAYVLLGALGVSEKDARRDFGFTWYLEAKSDVAMDTEGDDGYEGLTKLLNALPSGSTFKARCVAYLKACGTAAGDSNPEGKITAFQNAMLEEVEYQEDSYELPKEDTFEYVNCYTKREEGSGGSLGSSCAIYTTASGTKKYSVQDPELLSYSVCLHFYPYSSYKYARPIAGMFRAGKVIFDGTYALNNGRPLTEGEAASLGAWSFKPYFSNEGHTLSDRAVIEVRAGYADVDNFDLYLTDWGKDKYTAGRVSVYNGYASIDIWKDATFVVRDFVAVSPEKTYIKFPEGNCANARFEARETDQGPENIAGWFSGGQSGTKQHIVVENTFLKFSASGKTSGVAGALGLEFELGANNKTTTAAMLQVTGALNINAGSTITVDAGGKGAGTYKLVSAGTLNDYANLDLRSNYTVTNCKSGYYGTIVKSGNNINLTIQEGTPPAEDEGLIDTEKEGDWGYRLKIGNEIVLAFTNHTKSVNWQVPSNLENVQFLVVGGGGGGGADTHASNTHGGAGGGGGGVVTGLVNFAENSVITVSVGAGGNGGVTATQGGSNSKYGAAYSGNASYVIVDGAEYFWTAGGGGDNGANESSNAPKTIGNVGNSGGSSAGSRPGQTERGAVVPSRVASVSNVKYADISFGRQGGAGYYVTPADDSNTYYGYFSAAGGGGGATTEGETASTAKAAGKGGEGLASDITGTLRVYGSGGGGGAVAGGCGALGGTGAGCGNMTGVTAENYANYVNAVVNQGGGGGGAARGIPGGKGGSGIVVLRYVDPDYSDPYVVAVPTAISGLTFTGSELTGVVSATGYMLTGNAATDAGNYTAIATLAEGYKWADGSTDNKEISWSIAKATNEWTAEPKISLESWTQGETAGVITAGVAKFGTVTASMTELPTEVGSYTITYTVAETKNYTGLNATVQFEIKETENVGPGGDAGDDEEDPIAVIDANMKKNGWGYVKTGLGDLHNEVAVVFTNHVDKAMSWTVPDTIENVQFLVVGGGGGGGGAANATVCGAGGAGGGGGCVVTGVINLLEENSIVTVNVGDGGKGGEYETSTTAGTGSGDPGYNSSFGVDNVNYITAYGGSGDNGYNTAVSASGSGGSNPGARTKVSSAADVNAKAVWDSTLLAGKMTNVAPLRNKGGHTNEDGSYNSYSSAGGGGATAVGHYPTTSNIGGWGGIGLLTDIAGDDVYYGSGGGGGSAKGLTTKSYYPDGVYRDDEVTNIWGSGRGASNGNGEDALPNQGGGGGGAGKAGNGGKGGSGIVVFRYTLKSEVKVDAAEYIESKLTDKVYTGSLLTSGLTEDEAYTVSEEGGVNVGEYTVTVTLKSGFVWADGNTSSTSNFTWEITKHENKWATEPLLSVTSWAQGYAPNVKFVAPVQTIGELNATITTNGVTEAFSGTLPTEPGEYTINYSVVETDNYNGRTWGASFKIYRSEPINGGYRVFCLGTKGNEEAMVFTQSGSWNIDKNLKNVQFLVVGGGGGGGADASATEGNPLQGGAGGGGGGVVTGLVNFVNGQTVAITVGTGGLGGIAGDNTSGKYGAARSQATDSSFGIGNVTYVTAVAGGGDSGSTSKSYNADLAGSNGGSGSGGRPNMAGGNADTENLNLTYIVCGDKLGNNGGSGCTTAWDGYGYAAAGGGGGAVHAGQPGYVDSTTGNYNGGNGGEGYLSDITGTELVYGSGGGGGTVKGGSVGGKGGTGAGDGVVGGNAASAVPNQGGGGGGGGRAGNGGNGGSGIVVFRYVVNTTPTVTVGGVEVKVDANGVITNITTACDNFVVVGDLSNYKFADYYTASVGDDGKLKIALNPEVATPVINETANGADDAIVVTDAKVALGITNAKVGLFYSVEAYSDPTCAGAPIIATTPIPAVCETLSLQIDKPNVDAAFFKIVVTDIPSAE